MEILELITQSFVLRRESENSIKFIIRKKINNMPKYNSNIHRRSIRLKGYDYSQAGLYFITICTQNRECLFGKIIDRKMVLNEYGKTVETEWLKSTEIRKEIEIHVFVVMPNHFHAIVEIRHDGRGEWHSPENIPENSPLNSSQNSPENISNNTSENNDVKYCNRGVCNRGVCNKGVCHTPLRSPSKTIGALIRGFKSSVTKQFGFSPWQRNYWEHIIRNDQSYQNISDYILNNPLKWSEDKLYHE